MQHLSFECVPALEVRNPGVAAEPTPTDKSIKSQNFFLAVLNPGITESNFPPALLSRRASHHPRVEPNVLLQVKMRRVLVHILQMLLMRIVNWITRRINRKITETSRIATRVENDAVVNRRVSVGTGVRVVKPLSADGVRALEALHRESRRETLLDGDEAAGALKDRVSTHRQVMK